MFDTIGWDRYTRERIGDLHREAARISAIRRARAAKSAGARGNSGQAAAETCCDGPSRPCC